MHGIVGGGRGPGTWPRVCAYPSKQQHYNRQIPKEWKCGIDIDYEVRALHWVHEECWHKQLMAAQIGEYIIELAHASMSQV